jgi:ADP-ribose pyrophosphatase YjhB (NUDIX family)
MKYLFCPLCASELVLRFSAERERQSCPACSFVYYENPKPCASVIAIDQRRVLLIRRGSEPYKGFWDIPGGFLENGEHPASGARREMLEETGLQVELSEDFGVYMDRYGDNLSTLSFCYLARVTGGTAKAASDAADLAWFAIDQLPSDIAFNWQAQALRSLVEYFKSGRIDRRIPSLTYNDRNR